MEGLRPRESFGSPLSNVGSDVKLKSQFEMLNSSWFSTSIERDDFYTQLLSADGSLQKFTIGEYSVKNTGKTLRIYRSTDNPHSGYELNRSLIELKEELQNCAKISAPQSVKLAIIQAVLQKENGYPTVDFFDALDLLHKQSLTPTLLLIDEVGIDHGKFDRQVTEDQLKLIKKVQELDGQILVCTRTAQPDLKPILKEAIAGANHTFYSVIKLNKLENQELRTRLQKADFVVVSGFDTNECVRRTVGAKRDDWEYDNIQIPGLVQENIPTLYSDYCSRGKNRNRWEASRFESALFFLGSRRRSLSLRCTGR